MKFISYAQNYEDVMLWRALKDIKQGFYIDVGANEPSQASVTKAFYERGWRGINIEPVATSHKKLSLERPEDININTAVGNADGELKLFEVIGTGLSTIHQHYAERHANENGYEVRELTVPVKTLNHILEETQIFSDIHFLKVDVEGSEKSVLEGLDLAQIRPWIILVEATEPNTQTLDYFQWENLITEYDYEFVYFDGLNRFYVAHEHRELAAAFNVAPNVWDNFIPFEQHDLKRKYNHLKGVFHNAIETSFENPLIAFEQYDLKRKYSRLERDFREAVEALEAITEREHELEVAVHHLTALTHEKELTRQQLEAELNVLLNSTSMRITKPFRVLVRYLKKVTHLRLLLGKALRFLSKKPVVRRLYERVSRYIPYSLKKNLKKMYLNRAPIDPNQTLRAEYQNFLSPIAKQVLHDIKNAIETGR